MFISLNYINQQQNVAFFYHFLYNMMVLVARGYSMKMTKTAKKIFLLTFFSAAISLLAAGCFMTISDKLEDEYKSGSVSGTISLEDGGSLNGSSFYMAAVDSDTDGGNGWIKENKGTVNSAIAVTSVDYMISNVPAGLHYLWAIVCFSACTDGPTTSDYYSVYSGQITISPDQDLKADLKLAKYTGQGGSTGTAQVTGTLTLPAAQPGKTYSVAIDTDTNGDNGNVKAIQGTCQSPNTLTYTMTGVPAGTFYIYAVVFVSGATVGPPGTGDYLGFYGCTYGDSGCPLSTSNLTITEGARVTANITLGPYSPGK
jgi:hypothetical protein